MQRKTLIAVFAGVAVGVGLVLALAAFDHGRPRGARVTHTVRRRRVPVVGDVALAARYLGMERALLRAAIRSGKTLGEIANSVLGHSAAGLIDAIVSARETALADRLRAGTLGPVQARRLLAHLRERVTIAVLRRRPVLPGAAPRSG